ncbi:hypothetical protein DYB32_002866 [Aphanomyces invadans]|uniref:Uncharacterized protein n=1 Tax=Aphanomyces invadans TaxID=157072 RepID=A0A418B246_9STRA|nr:hypothetical protein DYB32_002866 [Aphanomyces invadans]
MPHSTSAQDKPISFGIHHLLVYPTSVEVVYTSPSKVLQDLVTWVSSAATHSPHPAIRDFALSILQTLALASGSLCALLHVVHCLLHSPIGSSPDFSPDKTEAFLHELATCVQKVMLQSNSDHSATKSLENRIIQQMSLNLQDEVTRRTIQILQNIPGLEVYTSPDAANMATIPGLEVYSPPRPTPAAGSTAPALVPPPPISLTRNDQAVTSAPDPTVTIPAANNSHTSVDDECASPTSCPALVLLLCQQRSFVNVLSELSVWQMQRMQRPEDFVGRREDELSRLEDPFSIQVSAELFGLGYTLLTELLAPWLKPTQSKLYDTLAAAAARLTQSLSSSPFSPTTGHALSSGKNSLDHRFTPNAMGLAVLQIVTSNVRRLVLSHVDPAEVGLQDGQDELIQALEHLIPLGTKRTDPLFPLSLQAAAAIEVGMEAFYPSSQLACIKQGFVHALRGTWGVFLHLVVALPPTQSTADVLQQCIAESIQQAGFAGWQVAAGAQEISITLQRHLHWNRVEKMGHDSGSGWIRVYPRAVATYDDVLVEVDAFVHQHAALVT